MNRRIVVIIILALGLCSHVLTADIYFVDKNHPDASNSGTGGINSPWLTIQHAVDNTRQPGDIVYVRSGVYDERVIIRYSGSFAGGHISIAGYPFDATKPVMRGFDISGASYVRIIGFEITHNSTAFSRAIMLSGSHHVEILENYIHHTHGEGGMIRWYNSDNTYIVVRGNEFYMAACPEGVAGACTNNGWAVQMTGGGYNLVEYNVAHRVGDFVNIHGHHIIVRNNFMFDFRDSYWPNRTGELHADMFQPTGTSIAPTQYQVYESNVLGDNHELNSHILQMRTYYAGDHDITFRGNVGYTHGSYAMQAGGVDYVRFYNNTFHNLNTMNPSGFAVRYNAEGGDYSTNNTNFNNIFSYTGAGQPIIIESGNDASASNNLMYNTGGDPSAVSTGDPAFVDASSNVFYLQPGSAARNIGRPITTVTSASGSGMSFNVADSGSLNDGFGMVEGDVIRIGGSSTVRITNISSSTITVDRSISWNAGDGVYWRYQDTIPDAGAYEYRSGGYNFGVSLSVGNGGTISVAATNPECIRFVILYIDGIPVARTTDLPLTHLWTPVEVSLDGSHIIEARAYSLYADRDLYRSKIMMVAGSGDPPVEPPHGLRIKS